jgi:hypothetical protein
MPVSGMHAAFPQQGTAIDWLIDWLID